MFRYKLFLFITCLCTHLVNANNCEVFQCSDPHLQTCTIDSVNCTEATVFQIQNHYYLYQVNKIEFTNSRIIHIPHGIFTQIPHLQSINLSDCGILEVVRYDFMNAANLFDIQLSHNALTNLKDSIFYGASNVEKINLSYNKITRVSDGTFKNLNRLASINLSYNQITAIASNVFTNLTALRSIDVSDNLIVTLTAEPYTNINLTEFNLSRNLIVAIDPATFTNIISIKRLNLDFNNLGELDIGDETINIVDISIANNQLTTIETNNKLRILNAAHNQLESENFHIARHLLKLSVQYNRLGNLNFVKPMQNLIHLDVSFNMLDNQLEADTFAQLTNLNVLYLESVNLKKINFQMFSETKRLSVLDISYNDLQSINFNHLSFLEGLKYLYINGNRLTRLALDDFEFLFPNLVQIDVSDNDWVCDDLIVMLKRFKQMNIKIYIDESRVIKNETNIRGIACYEVAPDNRTIIGHLPPKIPILHNLGGADITFAAEMNETRERLDMLKMENEHLYLELMQMRLILANITGFVPNATNNFEEYDTQINSRITNLTELYATQIRTLNTRLDRESVQFANDPDQHRIDSIDGDLKFIKIIVVVTLIVVAGFVAVKMYLTLRYRRSYRPAYNTMATVINESNI